MTQLFGPIARILGDRIDALRNQQDSHRHRHEIGGSDALRLVQASSRHIMLLRNWSGALRSRGDVCIITDAQTVDDSFTTTTVQDNPRTVVVCLEDVADGAFGMVAVGGLVQAVNTVSGLARFQYLRTSTVAGQANGTSLPTRGTFGQTLAARVNGMSEALLGPSPPAVGVYDRVTTDTDVVSTVAETTLYTKSIAASDLGTNLSLRLTIIGDILYNNNNADTFELKLKYGATTLIDQVFTPGVGTAAARRAFKLTAILSNKGATNSQTGLLEFLMSLGQTPAAGVGGALDDAAAKGSSVLYGTSSIDSTAAQNLVVTVQWSANSANDSFRGHQFLLEWV